MLTDRSPIYVHVNNTISGLATIRSTKAEEKLNEEFYCHSDYHTRSVMAFIYVNRWLGVRLGKKISVNFCFCFEYFFSI